MKVYVVMDNRYPDPEAVFSKKKHAIRYVNDVKGQEHHYLVFKYHVLDRPMKLDEITLGGARVVTDPSSY